MHCTSTLLKVRFPLKYTFGELKHECKRHYMENILNFFTFILQHLIVHKYSGFSVKMTKQNLALSFFYVPAYTNTNQLNYTFIIIIIIIIKRSDT